MGQRTYTPDKELHFKDAGAISADGVTQVAAANVIKDVGAGRAEMVMLIDVTAIDIANADEEYNIIVQGSNDSGFASGIENLAMLNLGATAARKGGAQDSTIGRYELPFPTEQDDQPYKYIRCYVDVGGTSPSIDFTAWAVVKY